MKEETKEIVKWIKNQLVDKEYDTDYDFYRKWNTCMNFLNSLPNIESHLCLGGYIQDENGTPCCHGDKVIYDENYEGVLQWDKKNARFIIASIYGDYDFTQIKSFVKDN